MNVEKEFARIKNFVLDYYHKYNLKGAVIGISGGKDSAVVSALMTKILGSENIIGVTLPCHSEEIDKTYAKVISDFYGFNLINIDLTGVFDSFKKEINKLGNYDDSYYIESDINLKPRLRMSSLYYVASLYSKINNKPYLVIGTSNKCEIFVGYYTKGGDNVCDLKIIDKYTVSEVIKLGEYLNVPKEILYRIPSDGLSNMSDEDKLKVKYSEIEDYLNNKEIDKDKKERIEYLHNINLHKIINHSIER